MEILFPSNIKCMSCKEPIPKSNPYSLCKSCFHKIEFINDNCTRCGRKIDSHFDCLCEEDDHIFDSIYVCTRYEGLMENMIWKLKYQSSTYLAKHFAKIMSHKMDYEGLNPDILIPVPSSASRMKKRGYNQSKLLAQFLGKERNIEVIEPLRRKKDTKPLSSLGVIERRLEIKEAFFIDSKYENQDFKYKNILIIDDILTTGTTIDEMTRILKEWKKDINVSALVLSSGRI